MKSKTNNFLLISFLVATILTGWLHYQISNKIGELHPDISDGDFKVCDEDKIPDYYGMNTDYEGGKKAIKNLIFADLEDLCFKKSGLVTFRFIVNCKGKIGRFRVKSTDLKLREMEITQVNFKRIKEALISLENWIPAKREYNLYDSYYVLNFKVRDGQIVDIF